MAKQAYNEIRILESCVAGDATAFEAIVRKYQSLVCAITFSAVGQVEKSEELAQQVFVNAWKGLAQLQDFDKFKAWLVGITRNVIRDWFRKQKRDIVAKAAPIDEISETVDSSSEPSEIVISKEQETIVQQSLEQIPEMYREPMVLFYRQQQSTRQVAEALELSEDTVRTRLMRGRKMLKEQVAGMIESTLSHTGPGKAFTTMVVASIGGLALTSATASAATATSSTGTAASSAGSSGLAALTGGITAKIITAAAVVAVAIGGVYAYKHLAQPDQPSIQSDETVAEVDEQEEVVTHETTVIEAPEIQEVAISPIGTPDIHTAAVSAKVETPDIAEIKPAPISQTTDIPKPAEYIFEAKGVLSGLITDAETGDPVTDAEIAISSGRLYRVNTDENGFYSFDKIEKNGDYSIAVYSREYIGVTDYSLQPRIHLKKKSQSIKHFQLPKACMIDLYVTDEKGNPVKGSRVWVTSLASEHGREIGKSYASQKTDKDGYLLLGGLAPSDKPYVITSTHYVKGEKVWSEKYKQKIHEQILDFAPGHIKVTLQDPDIIESGEIVLRKGIQLQGMAKYADGSPAKECKIVPYPAWWHSTTSPPQFAIEPNGVFTLDHIVPGTYRIQSSVPSGDHSSTGRTLFTAQLPSEKEKLLDVTISRKPTSNGSSARDQNVEVKLCGIVTDASTGKPIPEFKLRYYRIATGHYSTEGKWTQFNNDKGDFTLDVTGSEHAICKVQAVAVGYASQWSEEINTEENHAALINLSPGGAITGTVVDVKGKPVANAKILPYSLAGDIKSNNEPVFMSEEGVVTTDKDGLFTLKNIAAGTETLKVTHPDYARVMVSDIKVEDLETNDLGKIILNQGGIVEGVLYDNQGKPQPGVTLFAQNHYGFSSSEVQYGSDITDPNGYFRIDNLPDKLCYIVRPRSYQHTGVVSRAVIPADNEVARLDFGGGPVVRGRLVINGQPLKNTRLILSLGKSSVSGLYRAHADTDDNGHFEIPAGMPGTYTLTYNQKSETFTSNHIKIMDVAVGTKDIDLGVLPSQKRALQINIQASDEQREQMRNFYVCQDEPVAGERVFWQEGLKQSKGPYTVNIPEPGLYYAVIDYNRGAWRRYQYPIEITEGQDFVDITLPLVQGDVTLTGILPEQINHVWFTNEDQSVSGILSGKKEDRRFRVEGLFPGTYYLNPKWVNFQDCIEVTIPNVKEYTLNLDLPTLQEQLRERISVHVFDKQGLPVENAIVWMERGNMSFLPASQDNFSSIFYLPGGEHAIYAEKDGISASKAYHLNIDKNNTASGESYETYIQLK